jgi:hypothetical protein
MAANDCLEFGCIGLDEETSLVFNLCKNSHAKEKLGLAELNAPDIMRLRFKGSDLEIKLKKENHLASSFAITIFRPSRGAMVWR